MSSTINQGNGLPNPTNEWRLAFQKKMGKWMWRIFYCSIIGIILTFFLLSLSGLPSFEKLENPSVNLASITYDCNNAVLGKYYLENRLPVTYEKLSPNLVKALIATEDARFYEHAGIDFKSYIRVFYGLITFNTKKGGGSTITQQLAKLLYSDRDKANNVFKLVVIKLKEWITAVKLERSYTKEEIIANYLNQYDFNNGASGISAASEIYFAKTPSALNIQEAAMLIGMLQNASLFNPLKRPERCVTRRNVVLSQMVNNGSLSKNDFEKLKKLPLDISKFKRENHTDGTATYFRMALSEEVKKILEREECRKPDGNKYNLYTDGLKIYTTINANIQKIAEATMLEHMAEVQKRFFQVWSGKDPWTYKSAKTTTEELSYRQKTLKRLIYESERYQSLKPKYFDEIQETLDQNYAGFDLKDVYIDKLLEEEKKAGTLDKDKTISTENIATLKSILNSSLWQKIKVQFQKLQLESEKIFKTPVKMKVFAYNLNGSKDTTMSPLDSIKYNRMFLQTGILAVDPITGQVKAWVGGINHKFFQYDHVKSRRQVGSTFKPFIYSTAIAFQGTSPCATVIDQPQTIHVGEGEFKIGKDWTPHNAEGGYSYKSLTLMDGLKLSKNTVSVYLMKQLQSTLPVRSLIHNMGVDTSKIPKTPAICLGSADMSVYEMAGAYTTFANDGKYNKPIYITKIEDKNGRVIYQELPEERQALPSQANYAMVQMLKYVAKGAGGLSGLKSEIGGKTGTTNDYVDGWFMGITPSLVVSTWVGGEDRWFRFLSLADGQGARMARPFFAKFIRKLEADPLTGYDSKSRFKRPAGDLAVELDCGSYNKDELDENHSGGEDFMPDFDEVKSKKPEEIEEFQ